MLLSCVTLSLLEQKRFNITQTPNVGKKQIQNYLVTYSTINYNFQSDIKYPGYLCIVQYICSCTGGSVYCFALFCFLVPHINPNKSFSNLVVGSQDRNLDELAPISELYIIYWATLCPPLRKFRWLALAAVRRYVSQLYKNAKSIIVVLL